MKKFITWMLACFILISTVAGTASNVQAATVSQNNPVNGDYSYYAVYGTIYRVNNQTGKNKKIKALKDAFEIFDLTYYKGIYILPKICFMEPKWRKIRFAE